MNTFPRVMFSILIIAFLIMFAPFFLNPNVARLIILVVFGALIYWVLHPYINK